MISSVYSIQGVNTFTSFDAQGNLGKKKNLKKGGI